MHIEIYTLFHIIKSLVMTVHTEQQTIIKTFFKGVARKDNY